MSLDSGNRPSTTSPETRLLLGAVAALLVLLVVGLSVLFIKRPSPPFPPPSASPDEPTHTPPPTFTVTPTPSSTAAPGPTATYTPTPTPTPIVVSWRELGYLTVVEFTAKTIVEEKGEWSIWGTDWVLLEVAGKVQIGVDMAQIRDSDVAVDGTSVEIILPRPTVTSIELIFDQTHAYVDKQKVLFSDFSDLERQALDKAQTQLRNWIVGEESWMSLAEEMARRRLEGFLRQLGFESIEIVFREPTRL